MMSFESFSALHAYLPFCRNRWPHYVCLRIRNINECSKCISYVDDLEEEACGCEVPCNQIKYRTEVSYSKFPDPGTALGHVQDGYYDDIQYQRLIYLFPLKLPNDLSAY